MEATFGIPITAQKATVTVHGRKVALTGCATTIALTSNPLPASFKEYIRTEVHKDAGWVVQNLMQQMMEALLQKHCEQATVWVLAMGPSRMNTGQHVGLSKAKHRKEESLDPVSLQAMQKTRVRIGVS